MKMMKMKIKMKKMMMIIAETMNQKNQKKVKKRNKISMNWNKILIFSLERPWRVFQEMFACWKIGYKILLVDFKVLTTKVIFSLFLKYNLQNKYNKRKKISTPNIVRSRVKTSKSINKTNNILIWMTISIRENNKVFVPKRKIIRVIKDSFPLIWQNYYIVANKNKVPNFYL